MYEEKITEMKMPSSYVDMNSSELEYDGGTDWKKVGTIIGIAAAAIAVIGLTSLAIIRFAPGQVALGEGEIAVVTAKEWVAAGPTVSIWRPTSLIWDRSSFSWRT